MTIRFVPGHQAVYETFFFLFFFFGWERKTHCLNVQEIWKFMLMNDGPIGEINLSQQTTNRKEKKPEYREPPTFLLIAVVFLVVVVVLLCLLGGIQINVVFFPSASFSSSSGRELLGHGPANSWKPVGPWGGNQK